jgi:hypothetical protein
MDAISIISLPRLQAGIAALFVPICRGEGGANG